MKLAPRTAVSLYVALAMHALLLLSLALRPPSQNPVGSGLGLSLPGAGLDEAERLLATAPPMAGTETSTPRDVVPTARIVDSLESEVADAPVRRKAPVHPPAATKRPDYAEDVKATALDEKRTRASAPLIAQAGGGGSGNSYYVRLRTHLAGFRRELPAGLPPGSARVRFRVSPEGWISELELVQSSGVPSLDAEALDLFRRAAPLPPPPDARELRLIVPVSIDGPG
ncbi:TonB family protein [Panacagrimonas perspica]|uniref:TonB family protein n=1 Tax=Panacagrimonas perspica TaxID=381431 RepID=A0A4S3K573_9GAMM|nr:TonB family protein [Panacagrimonas perspica]TDU31549.1 TonB family protein [Panacagrimonas perspica]THD03216.1 hypothetical protein B1810_11655 [Panacagrimonas perspica]